MEYTSASSHLIGTLPIILYEAFVITTGSGNDTADVY